MGYWEIHKTVVNKRTREVIETSVVCVSDNRLWAIFDLGRICGQIMSENKDNSKMEIIMRTYNKFIVSFDDDSTDDYYELRQTLAK